MKPFGISHPKTKLMSLVTLLALLFFPLVVLAQSGGGYNLEWHTIDGGGHTFSSGGSYSLGGTLGQPDAGALSGGAYTLSGGFWYGPTAPQAAIRYAAPTAQGSGDCSDWANACTLQTALTNAVSGDEIWVKAGVHYTDPNNRDATFTLKNGVAVYGGFAGTESSRNERNWQTNLTILSGDIDHNDINTDGNYIAETWNDIRGANSYHVVTGSGTSSTAVLDGFIITAGQANGSYPNDRGGGMYNDYSSPTLRNLTFSGNQASVFGGGAYTANSSPTLINVVFHGNTAYCGGGMHADGGGAALTNVVFRSNQASQRGGGMSNYSNWPTLTNVTFNGNTAVNYGGGMYNYGEGGTSSPTLTNCILWGNTAPNGPQMYNNSASPTVSYSDIQDGCPSGATCGAGMLYTDPKFVNAAGDNLRLDFGSPAIDAGTNSVCPAADLDGLPRPTDGNADGTATCDMGAYEGGTMLCSIAEGYTYTFADQSSVAVQVVTAGNLACLYVDEMETNHANATTGIQTGRYWLIRGLQSDKQTDASGFSVNLTLPHDNLSNPKVCKYPGSHGGDGWDCAVNSFTPSSVTRNGVSAFSDWAVGNNVGPTAVELLHPRATPFRKSDHRLLFAGLAFSLLVLAQRFFLSKSRRLR